MRLGERLYKHRAVILGAVIVSLLITVMSWTIQSKISGLARTNNANVLTTVVEITHEAVQSLFKEQKSAALIWAKNPKLQTYVTALLSLPVEPDVLANAPAQADLRAWLNPVVSTKSYRGFFIIGPSGDNLASARNSNLGIQSLLHGQKRFLVRIWSGQSAISLPQPSDIPLLDQSGKLVEGLPTMFVGAPIQNSDGDTIAILAFRLDPNADFSTILQRGRIGESGETYAFDQDAHMISESRFESQLADLGLMSSGPRSSLNVDIRDPGVNMTTREISTTPRDEHPLTRMAMSALSGDSGVDVDGYRDCRGVPVIGAWIWNEELNIGIASEMDVSEAYANVKSHQSTITLATIALLLLVAGLSIISIRNREIRQSEITTSEKRKLLRVVLEEVAQGVAMFDNSQRLVVWNDNYEKILQFPKGYLKVGMSNWDAAFYLAQKGYFGKGNPDVLARERLDLLWNQTTTHSEITVQDDKIYDVIFQLTADDGLVITYTDTTERNRAAAALQSKNELVQFLRNTATDANNASNFYDALQATLDDVCTYNGWPVAHAYLLSEDEPDLLIPSGLWYLADPERYAAFRRVTEDTKFKSGIGLPGRVLDSGEMVWIVDITKDPNFPRANHSEDIGLRAGFACPVIVGPKVVAVMEFFAPTAFEPDLVLLDSLIQVGTQLGRVYEREQAENQLRESEARYHQMVDSQSDLITRFTSDFRFTFVNQSYCKFLNKSEETLLGGVHNQGIPKSLEM